MIRKDFRASAIIYFWFFVSMMSMGLVADAFGTRGLLLFIVVVVAFLSIRSVRKHNRALRESRLRHGLCADCAYDLRGITSDRCPECGTLRPSIQTGQRQENDPVAR